MTNLIYKKIKTDDFVKYVATAKNAECATGATVLFECRDGNLWAITSAKFYSDYQITDLNDIPD